MDRIKEALGMGPGTFTMRLDTPAIPAGGFVRGAFECKLKKATDVLGVVARATATRDKKIVYEQTQRLEGQPQVLEGRWTLVFRIPREIQLPDELLPSELRALAWTVSARIELGLRTDPEASAVFEVVGAFPDGVPVVEPGQAVDSGTSMERVVNVLAADTVSAANRVSERLVTPHAQPKIPDYQKGMEQSSLAAELAAEREAQQVRERLGAQEPPNPHKTQILEPDQPDEPAPRRVSKPPLRIDEPIKPRARRDEDLVARMPSARRPVEEPSEPAPRRVSKPPLRIDEPIKPRSRRKEDLVARLPREPGDEPRPESAEEPAPRRVSKPPLRIDQPIKPRSRQNEELIPRVEEIPAAEEPARPRRVEKPPVRVEQPIKPRSRQDELEPEPQPEAPPEPPRKRVEKPPVQVERKPSRLPQPTYESDKDLRWKKPGKKK